MSDADAYQDAALELGKSIAIGALPIVGQAIDLYDTLESAVALYAAQTEEEKDEAKFQLILAIVGWVPGPGDGVKKSLRLVNKDPDRYAPILFDLLRRVLHMAGVETSPEALLSGIFDAGYLKAQMGAIKQSVQRYKIYQSMPMAAQGTVMAVLDATEATMPAMVGIVEKRLVKWKKVQRNSSSTEPARGRATRNKPDNKDADVAAKGKDGGIAGHAGETINATMAEKALAELTNETVGISGEHIADYICAFTFKWGTDWQQHDDGTQGRWTEGTPGKDKLGKLSKGGSPKTGGTLYRLDDGPNGTGIDAVWRAGGHNGGKPYAIVEAKAKKDEDGPKFAKLPGSTRKPSIRSKIADNAPDLNPKAEDLVEPMDDDGKGPSSSTSGASSSKSSTATGGQHKRGKTTASAIPGKPAPAKSTTTTQPREILVQMSHEWILANIARAVPDDIADEISVKRHKVYSRHLFYAPYWHLSGSPKAHMLARHEGKPPIEHAKHDAYHYDDAKVKAAVNHRKSRLRAKPEFANLAGLKEEK